MKGLKDYRFKLVWASTSSFMGVKAFEQFFYAIGRNFSTAIPLGSCFECLRREYSFLVLTLGGASRSCSSLFKPRMSFRYFSYALSIILRTMFLIKEFLLVVRSS